MHRSAFLKGQRNAPAHLAGTTHSVRTNSTLAPYAGVWDTAQVTHLLKRTMFGAKFSDIQYFKGRTMNQSVDELMTAAPVPSPPVNHYQGKDDGTGMPLTDPTGILKGQTWVNAGYGDGTTNYYRDLSLRSWWAGLMINQGRSITEKMVLFWHNHFSTEMNVVGDSRFAYKYHALLRQYALGNFKQFAKAISTDPMMLVYLNGYLNTKSAPDENFGRELQELFVCGKGPNSKYTEDDVKAAARVLTGIGLSYSVPFGLALNYVYYPTNHDTSNKQFSAFYNNTVITGQSGPAGINELDSLINMIFEGKNTGQAYPEAAYFICRKLYRWFVYYSIDAATETNIIAPMAQALYTSGWDINVPLKLLLKSEHFYDTLNMGCMIKSGVDYTIGLIRETGLVLQDADVTKQYDMWMYVNYFLGLIQQPIGDPPNVAGWPAYYQEPLYYETWINTDTLPKRQQFNDLLLNYGYGLIPAIDVIAFADSLSNPSNPNTLLTDTLTIVLKMGISQTNIDFIKTYTLLSGQTNDVYWTQAWNLYKADTTNAVNKSVVKTRLTYMLMYVMALSEYQLS